MLVTITIPTRNRANYLNDLLDSISKLAKVNFKWEVLIIDNDSDDDTERVVRK